MNRREFIKTIPILATVSYLPNIGVSKSRHLITLGTSAAMLLENNYSKLDFDSFTIINDCYPKSSEVKAEYFNFSSPDEAYDFLGERKFLKKEPFPLIEISNDLKKSIKGKTGEIVILAALGKFTGTALSVSLAKVLAECSNIRFVESIPFSFEGTFKRDQAIKAASIIESIHPAKFVDLEDIRRIYGNLSVRSAFGKADEEIMKVL
jgi:hypothetical protein